MSRHDGTADLALLFSVLEPCVKPILKALQESIQQIDHSRLLYSSYKQCNEYQIWVVDTSSCSGMKVTTTTMTAGTTGPGRNNTLSIQYYSLLTQEREIRHMDTTMLLDQKKLYQSRVMILPSPSYGGCWFYTIYLCNNSFSKMRKIVNTAS